jgi:hypothetical protein
LIIKTKNITREIHVLDLESLDEMLENMKKPQVLLKQSCTIFTSLQYLKFGSLVEREQLRFDSFSSVSFSSNISKLNIEVYTLNDCLFLLDIKFDRLTHLYVKIWSFHDLYLTLFEKNYFSIPSQELELHLCIYCQYYALLGHPVGLLPFPLFSAFLFIKSRIKPVLAGMWRREKNGGVQEKIFQNFMV